MPDYEWVHREMQKSGVTLGLLWMEYCEQCHCKFRVQSSTCTGNEPCFHGDLAPPSWTWDLGEQRDFSPLLTHKIASHPVPAVNNLSGLLPDILLTPGISVTQFLGEQRKDLCLNAHPIEMCHSDNLGNKEKISRWKFPRLIFSCPVPSGLPHRSHCVPMNMNPWKQRLSALLAGVPERIWTSDPTLRRRVLYPTELLRHGWFYD